MPPTLYDTDFNQWIEETAKTLKDGNFQALDLANLIEEIEAMGRRDKREIYSRMKVLLMQLLKCKYQPKKQTRSWIATINTIFQNPCHRSARSKLYGERIRSV